MPDSMLSADAIDALSPYLRKAFEAAVPVLTRYIKGLGKSYADKFKVNLLIGFSAYCETSRAKCSAIKTIATHDRPIDLSDIYVNVNFKHSRKIIHDTEIIGKAKTYKHIVISGSAGSGKSLFMKYLVSQLFCEPQGVVPIFIELRDINNMTTKDLKSYLFHSCSSDSQITQEQFEIALKSGVIAIILDGFDELEHEHRNDIERQIHDINKDYPNTITVISSRKDDRFASWTQYYIFDAEPMNKAQVIELIGKIDYEKGVKRRFIKEIKAGLYEKHKSFLSSPLLATIMLLTYEQFAEIPSKTHIFYEQAFDTLFRRHDATKYQYKRKLKTGLAIDDFSSIFSAFCANTYLEQKFSFSDKQIISVAKMASAYTGINVDPNNFINDLCEGVCVIQRDGVDYAFSHRSFQEYFAALFASTLSGERFSALLTKYAYRARDSVMSMLLEMNRDRVEAEWVLPTVQSLIKFMEERDICLGELMGSLCTHILFDTKTKTVDGFTFPPTDEPACMECIGHLYPKHIRDGHPFHLIISKLGSVPPSLDKRICECVSDGRTETWDDKILAVLEVGSKDNDWMVDVGIDKSVSAFVSALRKIEAEILDRQATQKNILAFF